MAGNAHPPVEALFVDCDDCLYQNNWATAEKITTAVAGYVQRLGISKDQAYELYKKYGTCLKGLLVEGLINEAGVEEYLHEAHNIDYSDISNDPKLRKVLERINTPCWIFTASTREHAKRCLDGLGFADLDWRGFIDTRTCNLESKHSASSFQVAMNVARVKNTAACVLCDDSITNIEAAKAMGWRTVLVGLTSRDTGLPITSESADVHVASLHALPDVLPELFYASDENLRGSQSTGRGLMAGQSRWPRLKSRQGGQVQGFRNKPGPFASVFGWPTHRIGLHADSFAQTVPDVDKIWAVAFIGIFVGIKAVLVAFRSHSATAATAPRPHQVV